MSHLKQALKFLKKPGADISFRIYKEEVTFAGPGRKELVGIYSFAEEALEAWDKCPVNTIMDGGWNYYVYANCRTKDLGYAWRPTRSELKKLNDRGH